MGLFEIPQFKRSPGGILALVLGIILGGFGILITGIIEKHKDTIIIGVLQIVATLLLGLGWIWAVIWGILIFIKSN